MQIRAICYWVFIITLSLLLPGCKHGGEDIFIPQGSSVVVTAKDRTGKNVPNVTIVLGDSNGVMKAYGTTDTNGQISFMNAPHNATVTAASSCLYQDGAKTSYVLRVEYDVNASINMTADTCSGPAPQLPHPPGELGTVTLNVTNTLSGVTRNQVLMFGRSFLDEDTLITTQTIAISSYDLQDDGKLSIIVLGKDLSGEVVGYGALFGLTFENGMTVDITVDKPMNFLDHQITNIPSTAKMLYSHMYLYSSGRRGIAFDDKKSFSSALSSTTLSIPYVPGVGDRVISSVYVYLDQDDDGIIDSHQSLHMNEILLNTTATQTFDLNNALNAPYDLGMTGVNTTTPTYTWSGVDPRATYITVGLPIYVSTTSTRALFIGNLSNNRTSITIPELPDSLAAFRLNGIDYFYVNTSASVEGMSAMSISFYPYESTIP